jgi:hypothetical protein
MKLASCKLPVEREIESGGNREKVYETLKGLFLLTLVVESVAKERVFKLCLGLVLVKIVWHGITAIDTKFLEFLCCGYRASQVSSLGIAFGR